MDDGDMTKPPQPARATNKELQAARIAVFRMLRRLLSMIERGAVLPDDPPAKGPRS
jgi:hypothetical protein